MNLVEAIRCVVADLLALAAAAPLVVAGCRGSTQPGRLKLIGFSALVFLATGFATCSNLIFGIQLPGDLEWNWSGKLACMIALALLMGILPSGTLRKSGLLSLPARGSARPVLGFLILCALVGASAGVSIDEPVTAETLAYQLLMPSLAEEPIYRAVLPALLSAALGSPWRISGAQLGWWWLTCSLLFGMGHAFSWSPEGSLEFHAALVVLTGTIGLAFGWLAARCGSVWPCVLGHSLINSTGLAIAMASA